MRCIRIMMAAIMFGVVVAASATNHALLVGVSNYPSLRADLQLQGPKNDVVLFRALLETRGFAPANIRVLADGVPGAHGDPTRARILDELNALTQRVARGDLVFLFMAGHGSQQPARDHGPNNPESDGLDEIFLPRDIGKWSGTSQTVENAIVDDELGVMITALRDKGAFVWAVFDTCHAGTVARGVDDDSVRYRNVSPVHLGIPTVAMDHAAGRGASVAGNPGAPMRNVPMAALQTARVSAAAGGFVAFYAAQSWERAPESLQPAYLPRGHPHKKAHGVLSFALAEVIAMNPGISYRQASEQILHRYRAALRNAPTPLFEGDGGGLDAPLFGVKPGAQIVQWKIQKSAAAVRVPAGLLHRIAEGAVFSVMANPADSDNATLGFVQAAKADLLESTLAGVAHGGRPLFNLDNLPNTAYARLVHPNMSLALRVSLPASTTSTPENAAWAAIDQLRREKIDGLAVTWLSPREEAEVRLVLREGHLWFLSAGGYFPAKSESRPVSIDLNRKSGQQVRDMIIDTLRTIARATNLIRLAAMTGSTHLTHNVDLRLIAMRADKSMPIDPGKISQLRDGDRMMISVHNQSNAPVDINLLFIDSRYGIAHVANERFEARGQRIVDIGTVNTRSTAGRESLLAIASEALPGMPSADFSFLAQATLVTTRAVNGGNELRDLLEAAGFQPERTRNLAAPARVLGKTAFRLFTWHATRW